VSTQNSITRRIEELEEELKHNGLWQKDTPCWVEYYDNTLAYIDNDFAQWLQFVFIPNHLLYIKNETSTNKISLVPQAIKYFGIDVNKGKLLQILIEIDSMI
jgi:uncharacterized protein YqcC (DUF446 family)